MNYLKKYTLACLFACIHLTTFAQLTQPEGYFTSEAKAVAVDSGIIVSIKKFNPTEADIQNAIKPPKNGPWNYLMLPYGTNKVLLNNKGFESKLYSLNKVGEVVWEYTLGYSDKSQASPVVIQDNFIFAGESDVEDNKIAIQKIDYDGNVIWKKNWTVWTMLMTLLFPAIWFVHWFLLITIKRSCIPIILMVTKCFRCISMCS